MDGARFGQGAEGCIASVPAPGPHGSRAASTPAGAVDPAVDHRAAAATALGASARSRAPADGAPLQPACAAAPGSTVAAEGLDHDAGAGARGTPNGFEAACARRVAASPPADAPTAGHRGSSAAGPAWVSAARPPAGARSALQATSDPMPGAPTAPSAAPAASAAPWPGPPRAPCADPSASAACPAAPAGSKVPAESLGAAPPTAAPGRGPPPAGPAAPGRPDAPLHRAPPVPAAGA